MSNTNITRINLTKNIDPVSLSGTLFLIGGLQWFIGLLAAESWYEGYSSRIDYVSDLGTGPTSIIYNSSVFIMGLLIVIGSFFLHQAQEKKLLPALLTVSGIGAMGVGVFPGNLQPMHSIFTLLAILFGAFAIIASYSHQKKPLSYISIILGMMSLVLSFVFFPYLGLPVGSTETFLGIAKGSMERWAIYPILAWIIAFGSYLIGTSDSKRVDI